MVRRISILVVFASLILILITLMMSGVAGAQTATGPSVATKLASLFPEQSPVFSRSITHAPSTQTGTKGPSTEPAKVEADSTGVRETAPKVSAEPQPAPCKRTITADVVALPQAIMLNRLGAVVPDALIFALKRDTVTTGGQIRLRHGKRARPMVLRANVGDCLQITLTNSVPASNFGTTLVLPPASAKTGTQELSLHVQGMEWVVGSQDDGSFVGKNNSSLANPAPTPMPPQRQIYTLYARQEGTFLLYTMGDSSSGAGIQLARGLFGAVNVQPQGAEWYRSQVTANDLNLATFNANKSDQVPPNTLVCTTQTACTFSLKGKTVGVVKTSAGYLNTPDNHPVINYDAKDTRGTPILKMLDDSNRIVHTDLTAIITGPNAGRFPGTTGPDKPEPPCNGENNPARKSTKVDPLFCENPASPDRKQPYREVTIIYHEVGAVASQAFPVFYDSQMANTVNAGFDGFAINYGTGGIGAEIYANRIGVGPMGGCVDCKFEEFFLSAWSVGDPATLVDRPANASLSTPRPSTTASPCTRADFEGTPNKPPNPHCANERQPVVPSSAEPYTLAPLAKATRVYYPDDPSNVYHSYINDHTKFRILHGGAVGVSHVHHQHAHQWLQSPNSDQSSYQDSQLISPGASYTLEMVYNGSGNRNKVVGDSMFHCHFYPHFAAGMWAMWRTHDVFESGTFLYPEGLSINGKDVGGQAVPGSRALPDGEIVTGTPIPAVVPLPTIPMAPLPAYVQIQNNVEVNGALTAVGGQVVIGGTCQKGMINGLGVIGGCTDGQRLNGRAINSKFNLTHMTGRFEPSASNQVENPGFPFFIPGIAGARAPHPPFDFAPDGVGGVIDGGLPRHVVTGGSISYERHTELDWSKDVDKLNAVGLPETGTAVELAAIAFFKQRCHQTFLPDGTPTNCAQPKPFGFIVNGLPLGPQPGAPFADPAVDDDGKAVGFKRTYKAAAIQLNVRFNNKGWHFPQQRMLTLWEDVLPTLTYTSGGSGGRQPEPLFFRGNSGDVIEYWHTNLVPSYYLVDDFQVRTPTDILGQHINLVKFDVTSSDGAGNGFNYEDGTFSPQEVQDRIKAINKAGGLLINGQPRVLVPKMPPKEILNCASNAGDPRCAPCPDNWTPNYRPQCASWMGAQTTIQRWYLDPLVDNSGVDRTMRTVLTHDHFGGATHQQAGLYAGLLIEPRDSIWRNPEDGTAMGRPANQPPVRPDGGPTSWKADIHIKNADNKDVSYREFALAFQDLQLAYAAGSVIATTPKTQPNPNPSQGWRDPAFAINPAVQNGIPMPRLISTGNSPPTGTQSVNYLHDPIPWRVGQFGDLSYSFDSSSKQASNMPPIGDPSTPLMRAYQNDNVQIRVLVGAHVFPHQFNLEGPSWLAEPSWKNSGYRSSQAMGTSEHFELLFKVPSSSAPNTGRKCPDGMSQSNCVDYLYSPSFNETGLANGMWGLFRAYDPTKPADKLHPLSNNPIGPTANVSYSTCPTTLMPPAVKRVFNITAVTAQKALEIISPVPGSNPRVGQIVFNSRGTTITSTNGVMYVRTEDLDAQGRLKLGTPVEPLILRASAGDCIEVYLTNALDPSSAVFQRSFFMAPPFDVVVGDPATSKPIFQPQMSGNVGLRPQLLSYDAAQSNGTNVGWNRQGQLDQVAGFGKTVRYEWYAGKVERDDHSGELIYKPVEFGSLNLFPSDPLYQQINGLFGAMIIEPQGSTWKCGDKANLADCDPSTGPPPTTRASATVTLADKTTTFREFALMISDNMAISQRNTSAVNYRTEPTAFRYANNSTTDFSCMLSNQLIQQGPKDPQTPLLTAEIGDKIRFRMAHPFGTGTSQVFTLHGHVWQRNPYRNDSTEIGDNAHSQWLGSRDNHGSTDHFDLVVDKAGGEAGQAGDYLYTVFVPNQSAVGAWGIFRVGNSNGLLLANPACKPKVPTRPYAAPRNDLERFVRQPVNENSKP